MARRRTRSGYRASPLDYLPLYVFRWRDSEAISAMDAEARGAYVELLVRQWIDGSVPPTVSALSRTARAPVSAIRRVLSEFPFVPGSRSRRANPQLAEIRSEQELRYARRAAAGSLGGEKLGKQCSSNAKATASIDQTDQTELIRSDQPNGSGRRAEESSGSGGGNGRVVGCGRCKSAGAWAGFLAESGRMCVCSLGKFRRFTYAILKARLNRDPTPDEVGDAMIASGKVAP